MERAERIGLGVAAAGHVLLFAILALGFRTDDASRPKETPLEVSLVKDVGLEAAAPQVSEAPAQSVAPDQGEPEDAPAPAAEPAPQPEPAPAPAPEPQPAPAPRPAPARPAPAPRPVPQPKPQPAPKQAAPAPAKAQPKTPARPAAPAAAKAPPAPAKATGTSRTPTAAQRPRGSRLGDDFLKGLTSEPSTSKAQAPRAAKIDAAALASIVAAIARQIQPCADKQVDPGPGANEIVTTFNLKLNEDGTLAANPRVVRQTGIGDENQRYATRVADLGIAAFKGCSPLKLPPQFYSTPNGGWNNINYQWKLR